MPRKTKMLKGACIGDRAVVKVYDTVREGEITMLSLKGINLKNETGVHFFKWHHVKKVESALLNKISKYEEALQFYADYDGGKLAQEALKEKMRDEK